MEEHQKKVHLAVVFLTLFGQFLISSEWVVSKGSA